MLKLNRSDEVQTACERILVVDDDPIVGESLRDFLIAEGYDVSTCLNGEEALEALAEAERTGTEATSRVRPFNLVITDSTMPGMTGHDLLCRVRETYPAIVCLMLTGYGTIEAAVEAIRDGAFDYLSKPIVDSELRMAVQKALRQQALVAENTRLHSQLSQRFGLRNLVGGDYRLVKAFELVEAVAPSKATVLITGESGTGKSMLARTIHAQSNRRNQPFVEIHCGSIPETLLESELFGHVKGAFTGAQADKQGRFLAADGGTIFIDEINSASPAMQMKLLRVLQERRFEPVGSTETIEVDVRVVLATNQSLEKLVAQGRFRMDLFYRINVVQFELPPLRDRLNDIPLLAEHFIEKYCREHEKLVTGISTEAMQSLQRYPYPGNVRELENAIERAVVLSRRPTIELADLPPNIQDQSAPMIRPGDQEGPIEDGPWEPIPLSEALKEPEKRIIVKALEANGWNRQATADQLQINRTTLYKKMKQYGLGETG